MTTIIPHFSRSSIISSSNQSPAQKWFSKWATTLFTTSISLFSASCPGGSYSVGSCANTGSCATGYSCIQGSCCPSYNSQPSLSISKSSHLGTNNIYDHFQPSAPAVEVVSATVWTTNVLLATSASRTNAALQPPQPIHLVNGTHYEFIDLRKTSVCSDGTQAAGGCVNGLCGDGYTCRNGLCCVGSAVNSIKCLDGSEAVGACISSCQSNACGGSTPTYYCGSGYTCTTGNICCAVNSCPGGGTAIGPTINGLCPAGSTANNGICCSNTCSNGQAGTPPVNGICPTGLTLENGVCCSGTSSSSLVSDHILSTSHYNFKNNVIIY